MEIGDANAPSAGELRPFTFVRQDSRDKIMYFRRVSYIEGDTFFPGVKPSVFIDRGKWSITNSF
jgi:hypothetical protein